jgi:hypothetical protein
MDVKKYISINKLLLILALSFSLSLIYISITGNSEVFADTGGATQKDHPTLNNIKSKIQFAVDNGKITQAQADQKIASIEKRMTTNPRIFKKNHPTLNNIKSKIQFAVDNGKITQAQADQKIASIEKRMTTNPSKFEPYK